MKKLEKLIYFKNLEPFKMKNHAIINNFTVNGGYFQTTHRTELYPATTHRSQLQQHRENYEPWADRNEKILAESRFKSSDWKETTYALKRK